jgi:tRNA G10  N-methylase Trm11
MKYFFILGRNPELSRAEIFLYLKARDIDFEEVVFEGNLLILDLKESFSFNIQSFGGLLALGSLREFINGNDFSLYLEKNEFIELDKFSYCVLGNVDSSVFSEKFKKERKKAQIKNFGKKVKIQEGETFFFPNVNVKIFAYFLKDLVLLGVVEQEFSSKDFEKRDMEKPFRREELAISPRLAKILVNLSGAKEGDLLLDPFCGVGGILQEALLEGIDCGGIDNDKEAIRFANKNLSWLRENYKFYSRYDLYNQDSLDAKDLQYDAIACESSLGELLRKKLSFKEKRRYLEEFRDHIVPLLFRFKRIKKNNARIAIVFPCFEDVFLNGADFLSQTGLKVFSFKNLKFPIIEKRKDQFINRQIWVFY